MNKSTQQIRVLELFGEPISVGGQESAVSNFVSHMNMDGLHIDFLTPYYCDNDHHRAMVEERGGQIYQLDQEFRPGGSRFYLAEPLAEFLQSHPYDVIHIHSGSTTFLAVAAKAAKRSGAKRVIVHSHSSLEKMRLKNKVIRKLSAELMRPHVDVYCACSDEAAKAKFTPSLQRKVRIIKNGVDLNRFKPDPAIRHSMRTQLGLPDEAFVVGHVGRFCYEKNHEFLLSVFSEIIRQDDQAYLLLVGDGETRPSILEQAEQMNLGDRIVVPGAVGNVPDYLRAMDAFLFPSKFEGFGLAPLEAQAVGIPAVISDCVPAEVAAVDCCTLLSLEVPASEWAHRVLQVKGKQVMTPTVSLRERGFDIEKTAKVVQDLYRFGTS